MNVPLFCADSGEFISNRSTSSLKEDLMRNPIAEALAGSIIQYFHSGRKFFGGYISKV
ncbi:hypothetical protein SAMN05720354_12328 [Nitrosospira sp. Nsp1]|nr:hypothetical protein SAMN05720354_12328 [Nitrosospira sp. Nsp1]